MNTPNPSSFTEQSRIAAAINIYWSRRGFDARATVVGNDARGYHVESALVNGMPPEALDVATPSEKLKPKNRRLTLRNKGYDFVTGEPL